MFKSGNKNLINFLQSLRAISRNLLASGTPGVSSAFATAAQTRLLYTKARWQPIKGELFVQNSPTANLRETLSRARSIYGAGMGFAALEVLTHVVKACIGLRWNSDSETSAALAEIDTDITQAIQASHDQTPSSDIEKTNALVECERRD